MIGILDYGCGNLKSVQNALSALGVPWQMVSNPDQVHQVNQLILPGVGAFGVAMQKLQPFIPALSEAKERGTPILGICLGMQLLCTGSEEDGGHLGLNFIPADVKRFTVEKLKVPHMGWNTLNIEQSSGLMSGLKQGSDVYFVHSYCVACKQEEDVLAKTDYGQSFVSAFQRGNVAGVQFHPEKSQKVGLTILRNFVGVTHVEEAVDRRDHSTGWSSSSKRAV